MPPSAAAAAAAPFLLFLFLLFRPSVRSFAPCVMRGGKREGRCAGVEAQSALPPSSKKGFGGRSLLLFLRP